MNRFWSTRGLQQDKLLQFFWFPSYVNKINQSNQSINVLSFSVSIEHYVRVWVSRILTSLKQIPWHQQILSKYTASYDILLCRLVIIYITMNILWYLPLTQHTIQLSYCDCLVRSLCTHCMSDLHLHSKSSFRLSWVKTYLDIYQCGSRMPFIVISSIAKSPK